ncbi:MAG: histidinol-phosphate transaminase [Zoogloeaceae bacterium]|jgi:histidinol-phosphate aminotransferase|nr:histidinol-phosphate transaminase [Zoogloeaceae bacterium]
MSQDVFHDGALAARSALPHVCAISAYQPGKPITALAREFGLAVESIVKLASNENPLGMSPRAKAAIQAAIDGGERYPDPFALTAALAARHGVAANQIVLGNGSNDVLDLVARVFLDSDRSAIAAQYAFAVYPIATLSAGGETITVPAKDYGHDLAAMRAAIRADTRVIWIANPNNPTGAFLAADELRAFLAKTPAHVIVVLDEAYADYLDANERYDAVRWIAEFPNLVVCRTFSKIYGMAGLRIGYGVAAAPVAELMNRVRLPFNCNNLAIAGAIAALEDHEFLAQSYASNRAGMAEIRAGLEDLRLPCIPARGNFIAFRATQEGGATAADIHQDLLRQGVIVRPLAGYRMPDWLRVTIGAPAENVRFLEALRASVEKARN